LHGNGGLSLSSSQNPVVDGVSRREDPLCDWGNIACSEGIIGFDHTTTNNEHIKLAHRLHDNVQMNVPVIVEDVTDNVPSGIPSSRPVVPQVVMAAEEQQEVILSSQKDDDTRSDGAELANEVYPIFIYYYSSTLMFEHLAFIVPNLRIMMMELPMGPLVML